MSDKKALQKGKSTLTNPEVEKLQNELLEQENLINGFQKENAILYNQLKELNKIGTENRAGQEVAETEETCRRLVAENANLKEESSNLKAQLNQLVRSHKAQLASNPAISSLNLQELQDERDAVMDQLKEAEMGQDQLRQLVKNAEDSNTCYLNKIKAMNEEKQRLENEFIKQSERYALKMDELDEKHKAEIKSYKEKMQWYLENQTLLVKDKEIIKNQAGELKKLNLELEDLQEWKQRYMNQMKLGGGSKTSLPEIGLVDGNIRNNNEVVHQLQSRIAELETELDGYKSCEQRAIRSLQLELDQLKLMYEDRLAAIQQGVSPAEKHNLEKSEKKKESSGVKQTSVNIARRSDEVVKLRADNQAMKEQLRLIDMKMRKLNLLHKEQMNEAKQKLMRGKRFKMTLDVDVQVEPKTAEQCNQATEEKIAVENLSYEAACQTDSLNGIIDRIEEIRSMLQKQQSKLDCVRRVLHDQVSFHMAYANQDDAIRLKLSQYRMQLEQKKKELEQLTRKYTAIHCAYLSGVASKPKWRAFNELYNKINHLELQRQEKDRHLNEFIEARLKEAHNLKECPCSLYKVPNLTSQKSAQPLLEIANEQLNKASPDDPMHDPLLPEDANLLNQCDDFLTGVVSQNNKFDMELAGMLSSSDLDVF